MGAPANSSGLHQISTDWTDSACCHMCIMSLPAGATAQPHARLSTSLKHLPSSHGCLITLLGSMRHTTRIMPSQDESANGRQIMSAPCRPLLEQLYMRPLDFSPTLRHLPTPQGCIKYLPAGGTLHAARRADSSNRMQSTSGSAHASQTQQIMLACTIPHGACMPQPMACMPQP